MTKPKSTAMQKNSKNIHFRVLLQNPSHAVETKVKSTVMLGQRQAHFRVLLQNPRQVIITFIFAEGSIQMHKRKLIFLRFPNTIAANHQATLQLITKTLGQQFFAIFHYF